MNNWVRYVGLFLLAVVISRALVKLNRVRQSMHFATHPVLLAEADHAESTEAMPGTKPKNVPGMDDKTLGLGGAKRRISWNELDSKHHRKDASTDPTTGKVVPRYLDPVLEMRLSSVFSEIPGALPVLSVGVVTVGGRSIAGLEMWSGEPASRTAIEDSAAHLIQVSFETIKTLDEVDITAVPWRTVRGYKPPSFFSVAARRVDYIPSTENVSSREVLDRFGACWWDYRVMSDYPVTTLSAKEQTASKP